MNYQIAKKAKHLYVIGNGFDLHHDINSSYTNFRHWLQENDWYTLEQIEEIYGECDNDWWADFENQLGSLDVIQYSTIIASQNRPDLSSDHCDRTWNDAQVAVEQELEGAYSNLRECFHKWVKQLREPKKSRMIDFNDTAIYLNFNYTKTLENLYKISPDYILYIHGCVDENKFILGHGKSYEDFKSQEAFSDLEFHEQLALEAAIAGVATQAKPVENLINTNRIFFDSLQNIQCIHVYGLSLSNVDLPYIDLIAEKTPDALWEFSDYQNKNRQKIQTFIKAHKIVNYRIIQLEDVMYTRQLTIDFTE